MSIDAGSAGSLGVTHLFDLNGDVHQNKARFFRPFADLNRNRNTLLSVSNRSLCVVYLPSDNMFLLERIALLQEPMKVKIYISFYFVGLFFYLVTYWKKRQIFLVK